MNRDDFFPMQQGGENGGAIAHRSGSGALVEQESQRAVAEVQAAIMLAKRFPRDQREAFDRIMVACQRPTLAESALYSYARGGTDITGPSIRMAEAIAQNWGNVQFGIRELEQKGGESTVEAFAWDMETNTRQVKVFHVPHVRHTRQGQKKLEDPRDVYELVANQGARRLRSCILGIIPGDIVDAAVGEVEKTMRAKADTSEDGIKKMLAKFEEFGVTKQMIETRIQRRIDTITPAQMVNMRKVFNSLKDGMSVAADWFEMEKPLEEQVGLKKGAGKADKKQEQSGKKQDKKQDKKAQPEAAQDTEAKLSGPRLALRDTLADHCKGDEGEMVAYLAATIGRKMDISEFSGLTDEDAGKYLNAVKEQIQVDADFAVGKK